MIYQLQKGVFTPPVNENDPETELIDFACFQSKQL